MGGEPAIAGRNTSAVRTETPGYLPLLEPRNNSPAPLTGTLRATAIATSDLSNWHFVPSPFPALRLPMRMTPLEGAISWITRVQLRDDQESEVSTVMLYGTSARASGFIPCARLLATARRKPRPRLLRCRRKTLTPGLCRTLAAGLPKSPSRECLPCPRRTHQPRPR
jgi:hypothetical protein